MIFAEKTRVIYKGMYGVIDFVSDTYVVVQLSSPSDRTPPRLLVFREDFKELQIEKASTK
jgi:hypothetical protein